jgi:aminoglycoside phosphotransferase (APT) family kinase protein
MTSAQEKVAAVFPDLARGTVVPLPGGWTCETFEVDGTWIVQIARTEYAAATLRRQIRILPRLAPSLSTAIPIPERFVDDPPAMLYRKIPGLPCDQAPATRWPEQLGRVLGDLHGIADVEPHRTVADLRAGLRARCARLRAVVAPRLAPAEVARADRLLAALLDDDRHWRFTVVTAHHDLGPEHVLVTPAGELAGVIDWEEVGAGDPAWDLAPWLHGLPAQGERILAGYGGPPDDSFRERGRLAFALMPWHQVDHGVTTQDETTIDDGLAGVRARLPG